MYSCNDCDLYSYHFIPLTSDRKATSIFFCNQCYKFDFDLNLFMTSTRVWDILGRVFIAALFVNAVPSKLTQFAATVGYISSKGIAEPLASFLLICAIGFLIAGSTLFVFQTDSRLGATFLLIFLVPTTLIFHAFPVDAGLVRNLAVIGALILGITRSKSGSVPSFRELRMK